MKLGRFPRVSHLVVMGIAGITALALIPADPAARRASTVGSDPIHTSSGVAAPGETEDEKPPAASALLSAADVVEPAPPTEPLDTATAVAAVAPTAVAPSSPVDSPPAAAPRKYLWVGNSAVNVRGGPSSSTAKLFVLQPGEKVSASESVRGWTLVVAASGESGWVSSRYLSDQAGAAPTSATPAPPKADDPRQNRRKFARVGVPVTLRAGPSRFASKLFVLGPDERIAVLETKGRWVRVVMENGVSAWIDGRELSR